MKDASQSCARCWSRSPFLGVAMFGALIFLVLAVRKGDRGLLLVLPLLASIVVAMFAVVVVFSNSWCVDAHRLVAISRVHWLAPAVPSLRAGAGSRRMIIGSK